MVCSGVQRGGRAPRPQKGAPALPQAKKSRYSLDARLHLAGSLKKPVRGLVARPRSNSDERYMRFDVNLPKVWLGALTAARS